MVTTRRQAAAAQRQQATLGLPGVASDSSQAAVHDGTHKSPAAAAARDHTTRPLKLALKASQTAPEHEPPALEPFVLSEPIADDVAVVSAAKDDAPAFTSAALAPSADKRPQSAPTTFEFSFAVSNSPAHSASAAPPPAPAAATASNDSHAAKEATAQVSPPQLPPAVSETSAPKAGNIVPPAAKLDHVTKRGTSPPSDVHDRATQKHGKKDKKDKQKDKRDKKEERARHVAKMPSRISPPRNNGAHDSDDDDDLRQLLVQAPPGGNGAQQELQASSSPPPVGVDSEPSPLFAAAEKQTGQRKRSADCHHHTTTAPSAPPQPPPADVAKAPKAVASLVDDEAVAPIAKHNHRGGQAAHPRRTADDDDDEGTARNGPTSRRDIAAHAVTSTRAAATAALDGKLVSKHGEVVILSKAERLRLAKEKEAERAAREARRQHRVGQPSDRAVQATAAASNPSAAAPKAADFARKPGDDLALAAATKKHRAEAGPSRDDGAHDPHVTSRQHADGVTEQAAATSTDAAAAADDNDLRGLPSHVAATLRRMRAGLDFTTATRRGARDAHSAFMRPGSNSVVWIHGGGSSKAVARPEGRRQREAPWDRRPLAEYLEDHVAVGGGGVLGIVNAAKPSSSASSGARERLIADAERRRHAEHPFEMPWLDRFAASSRFRRLVRRHLRRCGRADADDALGSPEEDDDDDGGLAVPSVSAVAPPVPLPPLLPAPPPPLLPDPDGSGQDVRGTDAPSANDRL